MQSRNDRTIQITNIPSTLKDTLATFFRNFGDIKNYEINTDDINNIYAVIEYNESTSAAKALNLNNQEMGGQQIQVSYYQQYDEEPRTPSQQNYSISSDKVDYSDSVQIFVGDLSFNIDENLLKSEFQQFGTVISVKVIRNSDGSSKGYGFISFGKREDADMAIQKMNRTNFHGKSIKCNWATRNTQLIDRGNNSFGGNHVQKKSYQDIYNESMFSNTDVYVAGRNINEEQLRRSFQEFGRIVSVKAYPDRGHAFIRFDTHEAASYAIHQMDGFKMDGHNLIRCNWGRKSSGTNENGWDYQSNYSTRNFSGNHRSRDYSQSQQQYGNNLQQPQQQANAGWNNYQDPYYVALQQYQNMYNQQLIQQQQQQIQPQQTNGAAANAFNYQYIGHYPSNSSAGAAGLSGGMDASTLQQQQQQQQQYYQQYLNQQQSQQY